MSDGSWEVQQALYARFVAANISDGRVYDDVPEGVEFPYVQIGEDLGQPQDVDGFSGTEEFVTLHIWSRSPQQKQVKQIMSSIHTEMHETSLAVTGRTANVWAQGTRVENDPDGETRHGIMRLKISSYQAT